MKKESPEPNKRVRSGRRSAFALAHGKARVRLFACGYLPAAIYTSFRFRSAPVPSGRLFILHFSFFILPFLALAQQPAPPLPDEEDLPEPDDSWDFTNRPGLSATMRQMLDKLVPEGRSHEGLRYPIYGDGKATAPPLREAEFQSQRVSRLDDTWIQFTKAVFRSFADPAAPDAATRTVMLEDAIYDLRHDLIFSNAPVKIEDRKMSIHSGAILHDRTTGLTIFSGGVELYLQEGADTPSPGPDKPAAKPGTP